MRAVMYERTGDSSVLQLVERKQSEPGPGQVRVRVHVSGVNPTDWKSRAGSTPVDGPKVPNQDGAGVVDAVGADVTGLRVGQRVWLWDVAYGTSEGTAQESVVLPARQAVPLPDEESFETGASLGIPALTAHLALTAANSQPAALSPGALAGRTVLVTGGAGAVGHAAIQLAVWAGATVITTVSGDEKAELARRAGAHHLINYREQRVPDALRAIAPDGADLVVDVAVTENIADDLVLVARGGTIVGYATDRSPDLTLEVRPAMGLNARLRFLLTYTVADDEKDAAVAGVSAALAAGVLRVGDEYGMPLHRFPLERTADAHDAVERGVVGKVLIDV